MADQPRAARPVGEWEPADIEHALMPCDQCRKGNHPRCVMPIRYPREDSTGMCCCHD